MVRLEDHTIKAGFKYKAVDINAFEQQPYNPQFLIDIDEQNPRQRTGRYVPYQVQFGAPCRAPATRNIKTDAQAVRHLLPGRLGGQRQAADQPRPALGLRSNPGYETT